jgi:hypothetical protein
MQRVLSLFYIDARPIIDKNGDDEYENVNGDKRHVKKTAGSQKHYPTKSKRQ